MRSPSEAGRPTRHLRTGSSPGADASPSAWGAPLYRLPTDEYVHVRMKKFVCNATEPQAAADGLRENQNLRHRAYSVAKGQGSKLPWAVGL